MKQFLLICLAILVSMASFAGELRIWNLASGKTIEAEFVSVIGDKVALKGKSGKTIKIPQMSISEEDRVYVELNQPPMLDISFSKTTAQHVYPPLTYWFENSNPPPRSQYYTFSVQIKQTSSNPYHYELSAEIFVMAVEVDGGKNILIDYRKEPFRFTDENKRSVVISGAKSLMLTTYQSGGIWRGEKYAGYLVVVTDARGEIVGYQSIREWWFDKIENLRKVPVGKTFDKGGSRCWPTRPREPKY